MKTFKFKRVYETYLNYNNIRINLSILLNKGEAMKIGYKGKKKSRFLILFIFAIIVEVVVCNYRTWESVMWNSYDLINNKSFFLKDGQFEYKESDRFTIIAPFREDGWCDISAFNGYIDVKNIYLLCRYLNSEKQVIENSYVTVHMKVQDEGNELSYQLPNRVIVSKILRTQFNRLNPSGKLKGLELTFPKPQYTDIYAVEIIECKFNDTVPFQFSVFRFITIFLLILFIYYLRPNSKVYYKKFENEFFEKKRMTIICIAICVAISLFFANINPQYHYKNYRTQYHDLTESLIKGKVYLNEKPAIILAEMENPYDTNLRNAVTKEANQTWRLDWAYFNNKYFVYFGIVPVLFNFLPYYVITGSHLPVTISVSFFGIIYIVGCFKFLWFIFRKYFSQTPFVIYLFSCFMLIFCSGMFYAFRGPAFYGLPILASAAFTIWGLWFWYSSIDGVKYNISCNKVMCGSFCIALTAGCRPQFLIVSIISLFIFYKYLVDKNYIFSKRGIKFLVAWILPVFIIAIGIMYYNFVRFGSPFDFGANYNLTSNDMTHRGWHWDRTLLGIYIYLFDPTKISAVFPFILDSIMPAGNLIPFSNYMGITIFEGNFGGIVFNHPILILPFLSLLLRRYCDKLIYRINLFFMFSAILIVIVDTQMAGILGRYLMDFGWLLCLSTILLFSSVEENCNDNTLKIFIRSGIIVSILWGIIYEFLLAFNVSTNSSLQAFCPSIYYKVQSLIEFWL